MPRVMQRLVCLALLGFAVAVMPAARAEPQCPAFDPPCLLALAEAHLPDLRGTMADSHRALARMELRRAWRLVGDPARAQQVASVDRALFGAPDSPLTTDRDRIGLLVTDAWYRFHQEGPDAATPAIETALALYQDMLRQSDEGGLERRDQVRLFWQALSFAPLLAQTGRHGEAADILGRALPLNAGAWQMEGADEGLRLLALQVRRTALAGQREAAERYLTALDGYRAAIVAEEGNRDAMAALLARRTLDAIGPLPPAVAEALGLPDRVLADLTPLPARLGIGGSDGALAVLTVPADQVPDLLGGFLAEIDTSVAGASSDSFARLRRTLNNSGLIAVAASLSLRGALDAMPAAMGAILDDQADGDGLQGLQGADSARRLLAAVQLYRGKMDSAAALAAQLQVAEEVVSLALLANQLHGSQAALALLQAARLDDPSLWLARRPKFYQLPYPRALIALATGLREEGSRTVPSPFE